MPERAGRKLVVAVFIDALGWEIYQRHGFLQKHLRHAQPLRTTFGYSSACDPTILTGVPPREHGHFSFFVRARNASPFRWLRMLRWLPSSLFDRGRVRHWLSQLLAPVLGFTGYFRLYAVPFGVLPYFDYTEQRDIYEPGGINGGQRTIFDRLRERGTRFHVSDWRRCERGNLDALEEEIERGDISFAYLYLAGLDAVLHDQGTAGTDVAGKLAWYERELDRLIRLAGDRYADVELLVFSDHGMTDVVALVDVISAVEAADLRFGRDYVAMYDSTMARFWLLTPAAEALRPLLEALPGGRILEAEELRRLECDFADQRYGDLFYLMEPGHLISPSFMGREPLAGMHGYDPDHHDSVAFFAASCAPPRRPRGLADLHDLILETVA